MTIVSLALLGLATGHGCTSAGPPGVNSVAPATASGFLPAACEQREGDLYRTRRGVYYRGPRAPVTF